MGLILFNAFWSFVTPMAGGYLADTYWGRFKTINVAIGIAIVGHVIIIISAIPRVLEHSRAALGVFIVGLIIFGIGVGFFKCNISPLIAEQYQALYPHLTVFTEKSGERVIHDPHLTLSRVYIRYYFFINIGALSGQISMVWGPPNLIDPWWSANNVFRRSTPRNTSASGCPTYYPRFFFYSAHSSCSGAATDTPSDHLQALSFPTPHT